MRLPTPRAIEPTTWANLRAFAVWYLSGFPGFPIEPPPCRYRRGEGSSGLIIFRRGAFQAELVQFAPFHVVPEHCHPNVSAYDVHLSGTGLITLAGRVLRPRAPILDNPLAGRVPVLAGVLHSGEAGPEGARFLSLQHWHTGRAEGFIVDDWAEP